MKEKEDGSPMTTVGDDGGGMADQLAGFRHGPPFDSSSSPVGRPAGGEQVKPLDISCFPLALLP